MSETISAGGQGKPAGHDRAIVRAFFVLWLAWGIALAAIRVAHPGLEIGDGLNDADILHASRWFDVHGYGETWFLPVRETAAPPGARPQTYNTFPPGVFYLHEGLKHLGLRELWQFRVAMVALAQGAVWLLFVVARRMSGSALIGAIAATLYMVSTPYSDYCGGLWEHVPMLTLLGTLACWLRVEGVGPGRERAAWVAAAAACAFLDSWLTVQHALLLAVVIGVRAAFIAWRRAKERDKRAAAMVLACATLVCAMPAPVLGLRFAHQAVASGGVAQAVDYFRGTIAYRGGVGEKHVTRGEAIRPCLRRLGVPAYREPPRNRDRVQFAALTTANLVLCGVAIAGLIWAGAWGRRRGEFVGVREGLAAGGLLFLGAMTWPLAMAGHAALHQFVVLMFMPGVCVLLAALCAAGPIAMSVGVARGPSILMLGAGILLATLTLRDARYSELLNAALPLNGGVARWVRSEHERFEIMRRAGAWLPPDRTVRLSPRWPSTAYYLDRPFYQLPGPLALPLNDNETVVVDTRASLAKGVVEAALRLGVPLATTEPCGLLVYGVEETGAGSVRVRAGKEVPPGVVLREARWGRTMDGGAFGLGVLFEGRLGEDVEVPAVQAFVEDATGGTVREMGLSDGTRVFRGPRGMLVLFEVPVAEGERAAAVRLLVPGAGEPLRLELARLGEPVMH